jgi:hypothetical protein
LRNSIRNVVKAALKGGSLGRGAASYYVGEYFCRRECSKIGVTDSIRNLDVRELEAFTLIGMTINKIESDEAKKKSKRGRRGR